MKQLKSIYSLISLEDFKALLGVDDREDSLARFCLTIATYTIEQHCMRRFLRKRHFERIEFTGELIFALREYPVKSISNEQLTMNNEKKVMRNYRKAASKEE